MNHDRLEGVGGWLLVYLIGSIPPLVVYSMGLSGWFFEYPFVLMAAIFGVLAVPLAMILLKSPGAPTWNIRMMWSAVVLLALRSISVFVEPGSDGMTRDEALHTVALLSAIVGCCAAWATVWTLYFKRSQRVNNTFGAE